MERNLIYHAGCPDGFGAAWAARRAWGDDGRYIARGHDDPFDVNRFDGQLVVFADISLENRLLLELSEVAAQIIILDHHLTARDQFFSDPEVGNALDAAGHRVHFDLSHSGAVLSWQHFHPGEAAPDLLLYVEDQDLWNWKLPRSDDVNAAIGSYDRDFSTWDELAARTGEELALEGAPIVRSNRIEVQRTLKHAHPVALGVERIEAVNSASNRAAIGHELAKRAQFGKPWGLVYRTSATHVSCSIYSTGDLDVSAIATRYGGGGHRNASGFSVPLETWVADFA